MNKIIELGLERKPDNTIETEFVNIVNMTEKDIELLNYFTNRMNRVNNCALLKRGIPVINEIEFGNMGIKISCSSSYSDGELFELLHVLRPLILQEERASFFKIANLFGRIIHGEKFKKQLKSLRKDFEHGRLSSYMQINIVGRNLFHDVTLKLWLNSEEYHSDFEKKPKWEEIKEILSDESTRAFLINQIHDKVKVLIYFEYIAELIINECQET